MSSDDDRDVMISVRGLGKAYTIARAGQPQATTLAEAALGRLRRPLARPATETFWALSDVSFDVRRGDVVGVIGRNGAGKSTLFKVLSRITEPTAGEVELYGRVGSLLEVGTGFSGELTGRENIYLNGTILGMRRSEIAKRFDEIVDFAGVEKFLDTPVKRYSSGMYVRLAFAVAAHLETDILIVDEVLAVGDSTFQAKCLGKMEEVSNRGKTVLFVSHDIRAVTRLCKSCILMAGGQIKRQGFPTEVISDYISGDTGATRQKAWTEPEDMPGNEVVRLRSARVYSKKSETDDVFDITQPIDVEMHFKVLEDGYLLHPNINIVNGDGTCVFAAIESDPTYLSTKRPVGMYKSTATIPANLLAEGRFSVSLCISTFNPLTMHVYERDAISFEVSDDFGFSSARLGYSGNMPGVVRPLLVWSTEKYA